MTILEINQKLGPVYQALNNITVMGETNLGNLVGSLQVIKEILVATSKELQEKQE